MQITLNKMVKSLHIPEQIKSYDYRFFIDCAYMVAMRRASMNTKYVRYLLIDSSPQAGRDYLDMLVCLVERIKVPLMLEKATCLQKNMLSHANADEPLMVRRIEIQDFFRFELQLHRPPSVLLGMSAASVDHKVRAFCHALRLQEGSHSRLCANLKEFHSICPDFGMESLINQVLPAKAHV